MEKYPALGRINEVSGPELIHSGDPNFTTKK